MSETTTSIPKEEEKTNTDETSTTGDGNNSDEMFSDITPDELPTEMESLCMNCYQKGTTRLLLTRIPFFKEIVVMAFHCDHCNYRNNEIQSAGTIQEKGLKATLTVTTPKDLNRQIVKSESASIAIPELDFEIPPLTQKGLLNTIEGFLATAAEGLKALQSERRAADPETADKIEAFITKLESYSRGEQLPFTVIVDDPAGNSFVENPSAPKADPSLHVVHYIRTLEQNHSLGLYPDEPKPEEGEEEASEEKKDQDKKESTSDSNNNEDLRGEVMTFESVCAGCSRPVEVRMCMLNIPYFKDIVMMSSTCEHCGYKSTEVKAGGAVPPKGRIVELKVTTPEDLSRDILKSETATVIVPEVGLELTPGTLGGKFTTLEGLLDLVKEELSGNPFVKGDSATSDKKSKFQIFLDSLSDLLEVKKEWTIKIIDPMAYSYIQNLYAPDPDPNMTVLDYERSFQENEELGINDIKTENYEEEGEEEQQEKEQ